MRQVALTTQFDFKISIKEFNSKVAIIFQGLTKDNRIVLCFDDELGNVAEESIELATVIEEREAYSNLSIKSSPLRLLTMLKTNVGNDKLSDKNFRKVVSSMVAGVNDVSSS